MFKDNDGVSQGDGVNPQLTTSYKETVLTTHSAVSTALYYEAQFSNLFNHLERFRDNQMTWFKYTSAMMLLAVTIGFYTVYVNYDPTSLRLMLGVFVFTSVGLVLSAWSVTATRRKAKWFDEKHKALQAEIDIIKKLHQ